MKDSIALKKEQQYLKFWLALQGIIFTMIPGPLNIQLKKLLPQSQISSDLYN